MAQKPARSEDGPEGPRKPSNMVQDECRKEQPGWKVSPEGTRDPWKGLQQAWETQWQGFLKTLQAPHSRGENSHILETPWDDAKAFLASFEQVAEACRWPREEWVARLLPALSEEAQQAFSILKAHDQEDYGKVKAAILREFAIKMETQRLHFRQFRLQEVEDPRRIYRQLQELCCQWLKPERHTKEQILELLILEQFLTVLPPELQSWVREGGPENFSQAAALVEDFLMSQHHVGTWKWQEPLQRMIIAETEETVGGEQIYAEVKHSSDGDAALLGTGSKCPSHSNALFLLEGPEMAKANLTQELMNLKETGASLRMVEQTRTQPGQQTMFWQVMQEDGVAVQSLEGLLVPKPDLPSHLEKEDEISVPFPGENELLPGHDAGNKNRSQIKVENSELGGTGMLGEESQWELPAATAIIPQKSDEKRNWVKMENSLHKMRSEEIYGTLNEISQWNFPILSQIPERRCESNRQQEKKRVNGLDEYSKISESLTASFCEASTAHVQQKNPAVPMHGLKFNYRLLETKHTGEGHYQCAVPGENIQQKSYFGFHQRTRTAKKSYKCAKCGKNFYSRPKLLRHQTIHTRESPYDCFECGKSFTCRRALMVHQIIHTGEKPFTCPQCGKCFNQNSNLLRHKKIHTGEKMHGCPKCGKNFYRKDKLIQHQRTHTGEKPYECPSCGKGFTMKEKLQRHQRTHLA